ncbi:hypothetical protein Hanom_Chr03g00278831 [Helianthus anomalus]
MEMVNQMASVMATAVGDGRWWRLDEGGCAVVVLWRWWWGWWCL